MKTYSWGPNSCGQLGQGNTAEDCYQPVEIKIEGVKFDDFLSASGGATYSFILLKDGSLYYAGKDNVMMNGESISKFQRLIQFDNYKLEKVKSMWDFSLALTTDGQCLGWGSNNFGQLGLHQKQIFDVKVVTYKKIKEIAVGLRHCLALTEDGTVLSAGTAKCGALGRDDVGNGFLPVTRLKKVSQICCGMNHSLAITEDGKLYAWGLNKFGQLGLNPKLFELLKYPVEVELPIPPESVQTCKLISGWTHSGLLTKEGDLINWGRNNYGQLGDDSGPARWHPTILHGFKFTDVAFGSEHCLGICNKRLYAWGWNEHGNCGIDTVENILTPTKVGLKRVVKIGVGSSQSFALTE